MQATVEQIEAQALALPRADRIRLADALTVSLGGGDDAENARRWLDVALSRLEEIDAGSVSPVDADEVFAKARAKISR